MPALRERDEERQQNRADEEPVADLDVDGDGTGHRAQHEADGDRQHVDDDDVLEPAGVRELEHEIDRRDDRERTPDGESARQPRHRERRRRADRDRCGQRARRNRPPRLQRMPPIALAIRQVVHQINDAREDAEDGEGADCGDDRGAVEQTPAEEQPGKDHQVLAPLSRTQREEQVKRERSPRRRVGCGAGGCHRG